MMPHGVRKRVLSAPTRALASLAAFRQEVPLGITPAAALALALAFAAPRVPLGHVVAVVVGVFRDLAADPATLRRAPLAGFAHVAALADLHDEALTLAASARGSGLGSRVALASPRGLLGRRDALGALPLRTLLHGVRKRILAAPSMASCLACALATSSRAHRFVTLARASRLATCSRALRALPTASLGADAPCAVRNREHLDLALLALLPISAKSGPLDLEAAALCLAPSARERSELLSGCFALFCHGGDLPPSSRRQCRAAAE